MTEPLLRALPEPTERSWEELLAEAIRPEFAVAVSWPVTTTRCSDGRCAGSEVAEKRSVERRDCASST